MNNQRKAIEKDPKRSAVYREANENEDKWRDGFLQERNADVVREFGVGVLGTLSLLVEQKRQAETMTDRFKLTLQPEHASYTPTVELGMTKSANHQGSLDALKEEYNDMLFWATEQELTSGEQPRSSENRQFFRQQSQASSNQLVVTRARTLFDGSIDSLDDTSAPLSYGVVKRMVFGMPMGMYNVLADGDEKIRQESTKCRFERQIDSNHKKIYPIRTAYYLMTHRAEE